MRFIAIPALIFLNSFFNTMAQFPTQLMGGAGTDRGVGITSTVENDGYIIVGFTTSFDAQGEDIYVVRTDLEGSLIWSKTFGGEGDDNAWSVCSTVDGDYLIAGFSTSFSNGDWDVYLLKVDAKGNMLWSDNLHAPKDQFAWDLIRTKDGGYLITGQTNNTPNEEETSMCLKLNSKGEMVWRYQSEHPFGNRAFGAIEIDNEYFVGGMTQTDSSQLDGFMTRLTSNGLKKWTHYYGGKTDDIAHGINQSPDGNIIITGYSKSYGSGANNPWITKTDIHGEPLWTNSYGSNLEERVVSSTISPNGEIILLGYVFKQSDVDLLLVRTDNFGQLLTMKSFGSDKNDEASQTILLNQQNELVYTGRTYKTDSLNGDLFIVVE